MTATPPETTQTTNDAHHQGAHQWWKDPLGWLAAGAAGFALGALLTRVAPAAYTNGHPDVPMWMVAPFALLLLSIATMPIVAAKMWHRRFPVFSFALGGVAAGYYLVGYTAPSGHPPMSVGQYAMLHAGLEFYSFIALVGGLYVASGGVLVTIRGRGGVLANTLILAAGAVLANLIGTTGASVLLIRPFLRLNRGRLRPFHIAFFIFIVSNCGGALTPIGDPPLYLGFLKGVPFFWTLGALWGDWLFVVGMLLAVYAALDARVPRAEELADSPGDSHSFGIALRGGSGITCLVLIVAGVFIDPVVKARYGVEGYPIGATFQLIVAAIAYFTAPKHNHTINDFSFFPVKEVGLLFLGIFATMVPALNYLAAHAADLGIRSPSGFYFATGGLSAMLDNAPTYLSFLQIALGDQPIDKATLGAFIASSDGRLDLIAISTGAVFFGAMTYIGNGPNFMVKSIADAGNFGVQSPGFVGYVRLACTYLLPVLGLHWLLFIHFNLGG